MKDNNLNGYIFEIDVGFAYISDIIIIENMSFAAIGVFCVLLIFIDLKLALFILLIIIQIDIELFGWIFNSKIN